MEIYELWKNLEQSFKGSLVNYKKPQKLNKAIKAMCDQNEKFDQEVATIKTKFKKATEKLELKNTKPELKNSIEVFKLDVTTQKKDSAP